MALCSSWTWAHDVRLHIVGLHCGVTRVLKLRAVSDAYIYTCLQKFCFSNIYRLYILLFYFHQEGVGRWRPIKAHANGPNIVGQQHPTLLGPTMLWFLASVCMEPQQCWHLLAFLSYSLKPVKLLGPCKRTQHWWPTTPNNVGSCWHLLRPFAWALIEGNYNCLTKGVISWVLFEKK